MATVAILTVSASADENGKRGQPGRDPEMRQRMLDEFDSDRDGRLNEEERQAARDAMRARKGNLGKGNARGMRGPQRKNRPGGPHLRPEMLFEKFDTNGDQQLSLDEFRELAQFMHENRPRRPEGRQGGRRGPGRPPRGVPEGRPPREQFPPN